MFSEARHPFKDVASLPFIIRTNRRGHRFAFQPANLNAQTTAAAKANSPRKLNIANATRRALSPVLGRCALQFAPASGLCSAIHSANVLPCVTSESAALTVTKSSWIAASHNACSSAGNSLDASVCECRSNNGPAAIFADSQLGFTVDPCFLIPTAFAVATPGKIIPLYACCDFYVTRGGVQAALSHTPDRLRKFSSKRCPVRKVPIRNPLIGYWSETFDLQPESMAGRGSPQRCTLAHLQESAGFTPICLLLSVAEQNSRWRSRTRARTQPQRQEYAGALSPGSSPEGLALQSLH